MRWRSSLLFIQDGAVEGWLSYFWINEDKYLQLDGCNVRHGTTAALTELLDRLEARFAGYTAYFGFPGENREAADFLRARGFDCVERDWNFSFFFDGYTPAQCARGIEKISRRNFDLFRAVYRAEPDAYWSCDRILDALDDWNIFVYSEGSRPAAAVFFTGGSGYYVDIRHVVRRRRFPGCHFPCADNRGARRVRPSRREIPDLPLRR